MDDEEQKRQEIDSLKEQLHDVDLVYARNLLSACIDNIEKLIAFDEDDEPDEAPLYERSEVRRLLNLATNELTEL